MDTIKKLSDVQMLLKFTYGLLPIAAGADKFTNLLTNWAEYLNPAVAGMLPVSANAFMMLVGVIEILAGVLVFINVRIGAYVVSAWLVLIALTLLTSGRYLDVAVRDIVMAIGAFSLGQLSSLNTSAKN
jgi:uncharacterized membrane protein YphA (DoxX/SURF4 family)